MDTPQLVVVLVACFVAAPIGLHVGQRAKKIQRSALGFCCLSAVFGFCGFLISLLLLMSLHVQVLFAVVLAGAVTAAYAFFMANAKAFNIIR